MQIYTNYFKAKFTIIVEKSSFFKKQLLKLKQTNLTDYQLLKIPRLASNKMYFKKKMLFIDFICVLVYS